MRRSSTKRRSTPDHGGGGSNGGSDLPGGSGAVTRKSNRPPPRRRPFWTIQRATNFGIAFGAAALLIQALFGEERRWLFLCYVALLVLTIACALSLLWITAIDMRRRGTSHLMRPVRGFDIAVGLVLLVIAGYALDLAWPGVLRILL